MNEYTRSTALYGSAGHPFYLYFGMWKTSFQHIIMKLVHNLRGTSLRANEVRALRAP